MAASSRTNIDVAMTSGFLTSKYVRATGAARLVVALKISVRGDNFIVLGLIRLWKG